MAVSESGRDASRPRPLAGGRLELARVGREAEPVVAGQDPAVPDAGDEARRRPLAGKQARQHQIGGLCSLVQVLGEHHLEAGLGVVRLVADEDDKPKKKPLRRAALAALPTESPALVGALTYGAGKAVRKAGQMKTKLSEITSRK